MTRCSMRYPKLKRRTVIDLSLALLYAGTCVIVWLILLLT